MPTDERKQPKTTKTTDITASRAGKETNIILPKNKGGRPKGSTKLGETKFKELIAGYIGKCTEEKKIPLLKEFCLFAGIDDNTLHSYRSRDGYKEAIKRLDTVQEVALVRRGIEDNKPVFPIFMLKAQHGYRDSDKVDTAIQINIGSLLDSLDVKK